MLIIVPMFLKNTFQDKYFREIVSEQFYASYKVATNSNGRLHEHYPQLIKRGLLKYITQGYNILECHQSSVYVMYWFSEGNPFAQGIAWLCNISK